jgi:hypothetical protein
MLESLVDSPRGLHRIEMWSIDPAQYFLKWNSRRLSSVKTRVVLTADSDDANGPFRRDVNKVGA